MCCSIYLKVAWETSLWLQHGDWQSEKSVLSVFPMKCAVIAESFLHRPYIGVFFRTWKQRPRRFVEPPLACYPVCLQWKATAIWHVLNRGDPYRMPGFQPEHCQGPLCGRCLVVRCVCFHTIFLCHLVQERKVAKIESAAMTESLKLVQLVVHWSQEHIILSHGEIRKCLSWGLGQDAMTRPNRLAGLRTKACWKKHVTQKQRCIIQAYFQHPFCTPLAYLRHLHPWRYFHYFRKDPGANVRHPDTWRRPNEQQESACVKYIYNRRLDCETQLGCAALHCRLTTAQVSFMLFKNTVMGAYLAWSVCISFVMQTTSRFDVGF